VDAPLPLEVELHSIVEEVGRRQLVEGTHNTEVDTRT